MAVLWVKEKALEKCRVGFHFQQDLSSMKLHKLLGIITAPGNEFCMLVIRNTFFAQSS